MRPPLLVRLLPAALLIVSACASRREGKLPSLEDYSDGTSAYAEALLGAWKAGTLSPALFAAPLLWSGPLPGDGLIPVAARPLLTIAVYRAPAGPAAEAAAVDLSARLESLRARFSSLGRTEATIFDFRRRGDRREIVLGLFLAGRGTHGELLQEGGKILATLAPVPGGGWRMESGSVLAWLEALAPEPLFEERAAAAGLTSSHRAFLPNASKNVPIPGEHLPPGAAVLDFDGDGHPDLYIAGGDGNRLYRNRGDGTFEDATARAGVGGQEGEALGALTFDYDNDGRPDLYVTYLDRPNLLYRNRGDGTFEEVGAKAGVAFKDYSTSAAALDYDRDGNPDLYVLVYGHPDRGPNIPADNAPPNRLFHNNGDGTFTDVTKKSGTGDPGWGLAVESADLDEDGWPDIYIANDFGNHAYLHNRGDGTFENIAREAAGARSRVRDGRGDRRLRRRRAPGPLRLELFLPAQLVPARPALPDAGVSLLARPADRVA